MRRRVVLPTGRFEQFVELQFGGQGNLRQGLLGSDGRDARRSLLAQWRVQQIDALDLPQFVLEPFHGQGRPDRLGLLVQVLQQRHPQQTVEGVHADLAVGPVVQRPPAQPLPAVVFRIILHDDFRIISDANLVIIQIDSCRRELGARGLTEAAGSAKFPSGGTDGRDLFWFAADLQLN